MSRKLHRVVQHSGDIHQIVLQPVDEKMAGPVDDAGVCTGAFPTQPQMPGSDAFAKFWPLDATDRALLTGDVTQGCDQQRFVPLARRVSKVLFGPRQNVDDVRLCGAGELIPCHQPADPIRSTACLPNSLMKLSSRSEPTSIWRPVATSAQPRSTACRSA